MTAHSSQGRTLKSVIVDLQIDEHISMRTRYVAMTTVRKRTDILIFRPFQHEIVTQGPPEGPSLLLKHLQGEPIGWKKIEDKHIPKIKRITIRK